VRDLKATGIGQFYHTALRTVLARIPEIRSHADYVDTEKAALILCQGLGAEKYAAAARELWEVADYFDIDKDVNHRDVNDGSLMREAIVALGQVGGSAFIPQMVQRLEQFNAQRITDAETRRRVQMVVVGFVNALETLKAEAGFRAVFDVVIGGYEPGIRNIASSALVNIVEDPADQIIAILHDVRTDPPTMQEAVRVMSASRAPDSSRAKVASALFIDAWNYHTTDRSWVSLLSILRKSALDDILRYGITDDAVYRYLERSYVTNFNSGSPDYDEMMKALNVLGASKSDEAVTLLNKFLRELNDRRRTGPWRRHERQSFDWLIDSIQMTGTQSPDSRMILTQIQRNDRFTSAERRRAQDALTVLGNSGR
jgi:hypothetical protein